MNTTTPPNETIELEIAGQPVRFTFTSAPGLRPFVEAVLRGEDYPLVFPGVYTPAVIVDIGAHSGAATVFFKSHYPEAEVYCFEPAGDSFLHLCENTRMYQGVHVTHAGLGPADSRARLFSGQYSSMQSSIKPNEENSEDFEWVRIIEAQAALEALGEAAISVIKIDTEGCELEILGAIRPMLASVDVVYLEYHSEADRLDLDQLLGEHFVLYAARAEEPDRGTNTYIRRDVHARLSAIAGERYVFPKQ